MLDERVKTLTSDLQKQKNESQLCYAVLQSDFLQERTAKNQLVEDLENANSQIRDEQELRYNQTNYLRADLEQALQVKAILEEQLAELKAELQNSKEQSECLNLASQTQIRELEEQIAQAQRKVSSTKRQADDQIEKQTELINQ